MKKKLRKIISGLLMVGLLVSSVPVKNVDAASINLNAKYSSSLADKQMDSQVNKVYNKIKKQYPSATKYRIKRAFISTKNRMPKKSNYTMREYYRRVAIVLATIEVESNFKMINCKNSTTTDYGIMQLNSSIIPYITNKLGKSKVGKLKTNVAQNIEAGSYEMITLCYSKAKKKHPNNVIEWTYIYANRGLYCEIVKSWKSSKTREKAYSQGRYFKTKYNKYYNILT